MVQCVKAMPDSTVVMNVEFSGYDAKNKKMAHYGVFKATHTNTAEGFPAPTNKKCVSDYIYVASFNDEGKIFHVQKIWNGTWTMKELGWIE